MSNEFDERLVELLSVDRMAPYLRVAPRLVDAISLYIWNGRVAAAFFEVLGDVEVIVRNAIHSRLSAWNDARGFADPWFMNEHGYLDDREVLDVERAVARVDAKGRTTTPSRVIAELNIGFWRFLFAKRHRTDLWPFALRDAFPNFEGPGPTEVFLAMSRLNDLRNRIAHHEPVHRLPLVDLHDDAVAILAMVSTDAAKWVAGRSRVEEIIAERPGPA